MKIKSMVLVCFICLFFTGGSGWLQAQSYTMDWYKIAGGGGTSSGGVYALSGTIGQSDTGTAMTGGSYALTGGFWSLYAVQTAGLPSLLIRYSGNSAIVSWANTITCTLQQCSDLATGGWSDSSYTVSTLNGTNSVTLSNPTGKLFFRLRK